MKPYDLTYEQWEKLSARQRKAWQKKVSAARRLSNAFHEVFSSEKGKIVLEALKQKACVGGHQIEFDDIARPFSSERYFAREGCRQYFKWIQWNIDLYDTFRREEEDERQAAREYGIGVDDPRGTRRPGEDLGEVQERGGLREELPARGEEGDGAFPEEGGGPEGA